MCRKFNNHHHYQNYFNNHLIGTLWRLGLWTHVGSIRAICKWFWPSFLAFCSSMWSPSCLICSDLIWSRRIELDNQCLVEVQMAVCNISLTFAHCFANQASSNYFFMALSLKWWCLASFLPTFSFVKESFDSIIICLWWSFSMVATSLHCNSCSSLIT